MSQRKIENSLSIWLLCELRVVRNKKSKEICKREKINYRSRIENFWMNKNNKKKKNKMAQIATD